GGGGGGWEGGGGGVGGGEGGGEVERAAPADVALDPDAAAHQLDQPGGDGQPEAGAAILPRRGAVRLGERGEDRLPLVRRDADAGVANLEVQEDRTAIILF